MKTIVINALNSNSGGGKSIRDSYLKLLNEEKLEERYVVLAAKGAGLDFVNNPNIEIRELPSFLSKTAAAPLAYRFVLGRILSEIGGDVIFNLGDLIIRTPVRQVYLFDWSYALEVHSRVWSGMTLGEKSNRKFKRWLLTRYFRQADIVVAQSEYIKEQLVRKYRVRDVRVVAGAATSEAVASGEEASFDLPDGIRLVCPSVYYPHKNLEVLLDVAALIKARNLKYRIVTTVDPTGAMARRFVQNIQRRRLEGVLCNIGQVPLQQMNALYARCDALLMPTLLESFGLIYPEAMQNDLPIFTSDMWFAHSVCEEAAAYFDPFDAEDILQAVDGVLSDEPAKQALVAAGRRRLASFPSWRENFRAYQAMLTDSETDVPICLTSTPPG